MSGPTVPRNGYLANIFSINCTLKIIDVRIVSMQDCIDHIVIQARQQKGFEVF